MSARAVVPDGWPVPSWLGVFNKTELAYYAEACRTRMVRAVIDANTWKARALAAEGRLGCTTGHNSPQEPHQPRGGTNLRAAGSWDPTASSGREVAPSSLSALLDAKPTLVEHKAPNRGQEGNRKP